MRRITSLLLSISLLAGPALALDHCSMQGGAAGVQAKSCCAKSCTCPAAPAGKNGCGGKSSLSPCPASHPAPRGDPGAGMLVPPTFGGRSDLLAFPAAHPAGQAECATARSVAAPRDPGGAALPTSYRPVFELCCSLLI